jgi:hypothetical protein
MKAHYDIFGYQLPVEKADEVLDEFAKSYSKDRPVDSILAVVGLPDVSIHLFSGSNTNAWCEVDLLIGSPGRFTTEAWMCELIAQRFPELDTRGREPIGEEATHPDYYLVFSYPVPRDIANQLYGALDGENIDRALRICGLPPRQEHQRTQKNPGWRPRTSQRWREELGHCLMRAAGPAKAAAPTLTTVPVGPLGDFKESLRAKILELMPVYSWCGEGVDAALSELGLRSRECSFEEEKIAYMDLLYDVIERNADVPEDTAIEALAELGIQRSPIVGPRDLTITITIPGSQRFGATPESARQAMADFLHGKRVGASYTPDVIRSINVVEEVGEDNAYIF